QSAMKRLEKLDRIEDVEIERPNIRINFNIDKTPGRVLVELKDVSKRFKDIEILEHASAEIDRGDKIALIGANGKGKSTLLRIIAGTETFEGERKWGHNVDAAFYAQHQLEALTLNHTILEEMKEAGSKKTELELRTLLGCFLFSGDDADKKIRVLSGGEKARVALAKTILSKANFLLLDEPTNHLDIHSTELLVDALNRYEGSYILVSHDRYFISKTANKIWEITDRRIREFKGNYEEWVAWNERASQQRPEEAASKPKAKEATKATAAPASASASATANAADKSALRKELQKQQKQFQKIEQQLATLTQKKAELEQQLSAPDTYANPETFRKTEAAYQQSVREFETVNSQYEKLFESIMSLEEELSA
ncbi:MAG TPA: ATP-binding cassette domain-containing protein, partial [Flavisolibacter sp.]